MLPRRPAGHDLMGPTNIMSSIGRNENNDDNDNGNNRSPIKVPLDESDATSMTTVSTSGTPSPFADIDHHPRCSRTSGAMLSSSSAESSPSVSSCDKRPPTTTAYSMLSAFTPTPSRGTSSPTRPTPPAGISPGNRPGGNHHHHQHTHSGSSDSNTINCHIDDQGSWSDSDDNFYGHDKRFHSSIHNNKTPIRRTPPWTIQQALFPEEETENLAPPTLCTADGKNAAQNNNISSAHDHSHLISSEECFHSRRTRRAYQRSMSDSPMEYDDTSHSPQLWPTTASSPKRDTTSAISAAEKALVRTRRFRRSTITVSPVEKGFLIPEHRRRNSTGKYRASPKPTPYNNGDEVSSPCRTRSAQDAPFAHTTLQQHHQHHQSFAPIPPPPYSDSKSKKLKKQHRHRLGGGLEFLGLTSLEDRLSLVAAVNSQSMDFPEGNSNVLSRSSYASSSPSSSTLSPSSSSFAVSWRTVLCRFRLTTLVWGLLMVGLTTLGRSAMSASGTSMFLDTTTSPKLNESQQHSPTTGGLRGTLLLATVGRNANSQSQDHHHHSPHGGYAAETPKKTKNMPKKDKNGNTNNKGDKPSSSKTAFKENIASSKVGHKHDTAPVKKNKAEPKTESATAITSMPRLVEVARPQPLDLSVALPKGERRDFEKHDLSMFSSPTATNNNNSNNPKRVVMLHDSTSSSWLNRQASTVEQYPAEFTDNTQFYSQFDSSDERLRRMEMREPYEQGECVPMQDWQTTFHPSCNGVHELGVEYLGEESTETNVELFGTKGYWRYAWRLDLQKRGSRKQTEKFGDRVVLKTLKFRHDFEDAHFEHDRIDAVAMERLTSSPHVINVFGFCGHSVLTEYANGPRLGELADKSRSKPLARLNIARDIANGLADVHGIDGEDGKNATFIHLDINPANVVSIGGTLKLNDFNIGIIRRWNTTAQEPCGFPAQYPNPQWRSPEEARNENNLTEKVDVFSMGHIFFRLICGHEPWNKLERGGRPSKEVINEKVKQGKLPAIPDSVMNTDDPEVAAIRDVMLDCYKADPKDRPSAREIVKRLELVLDKLSAKESSPQR